MEENVLNLFETIYSHSHRFKWSVISKEGDKKIKRAGNTKAVKIKSSDAGATGRSH